MPFIVTGIANGGSKDQAPLVVHHRPRESEQVGAGEAVQARLGRSSGMAAVTDGSPRAADDGAMWCSTRTSANSISDT